MVEWLPAIADATIAITKYFGGGSNTGSSSPGYDASPGAKPNRGSADTEYVQAVNSEKQKEYEQAQAGINQVKAVPAAVQEIQNIYNSTMSLWGDPNNPNRNVVDTGSYQSRIQAVVDKYMPIQTALSTLNNLSKRTGTGTQQETSTTPIGQDFLNNITNSINSALASITAPQNTKIDFAPIILIVGVIFIFWITTKGS